MFRVLLCSNASDSVQSDDRQQHTVFQLWRCICQHDIPLLCILRGRMAGYSLAVQHRDQFPQHANDWIFCQCCSSMGSQLHGGANYPDWYLKPAVEILFDLGLLQCRLDPDHLSLLSRNSKSTFGGHRYRVQGWSPYTGLHGQRSDPASATCSIYCLG